jgi:hypothetical protein
VVAIRDDDGDQPPELVVEDLSESGTARKCPTEVLEPAANEGELPLPQMRADPRNNLHLPLSACP